MSEPLDSIYLESELFRVGRPPEPWAWPDWAFAGSDGTFGHRWDDVTGRYRVLYASSQRVGAFLETLAVFRPDPSVLAEISAIESLEGDEETAAAGSVPPTWCYGRLITKGLATEIFDAFVVIGGTRTLAALRRDLSERTVHYKVGDLDAATIRRSTPRRFTQEISTHIESLRGEGGHAYAGIHYLSRFGDDIVNWAIFERESEEGRSPVLSVERETVNPEDDDFQTALRILDLTLTA